MPALLTSPPPPGRVRPRLTQSFDPEAPWPPHPPGGEDGETAAAPPVRPEQMASGGERPGSRARPNLEAWSTAHRFVDLCLEIFNGYRPVVHIRAVSTPVHAPAILHEVASATRRVGRRHKWAASVGGAKPASHRKVRRIRLRVSEPSQDVAEVVAVLADAKGAWALAFRLERRSGTWLCTALTAVC